MTGRAESSGAVLRGLFWKLFFRGRVLSRRRGSEGTLNRSGMAWTLVVYALIGCSFCPVALVADTFTFAAYMHGVTLFMVVFQMVMTAGSVLFNKEEAEILLHRPVLPRELLHAKVFVLCSVSAILAGALNLPGMIAGIWIRDSHWWFPLAHAFSLLLMIVFSAGALVVVYQACLRWFGRQRLDSMMTTTQTLLTVVMIAGSQSYRFIGRMNLSHFSHAWWLAVVPPVWFASLDAILSAKHWAAPLLVPAMVGVAATFIVGWLGFHRLAASYGEGLMLLNETGGSSASTRQLGGGWLRRIVKIPPLSWWLRNPVEKQSFLLTAAYLFRDRETKLRLYPSLSQVIVMPLIFLYSGGRYDNGLGIAFAGMYLGWLPLQVMQMLEFSEHWRASDLFRFTPFGSWQSLYHGARKAALALLAFPALLLLAGIIITLKRFDARLLLLLPGVVILPLWSMVPGILETWLPFSRPFDAKTQGQRGCITMTIVMGVSAGLSYLASLSLRQAWFPAFMLGEIAIAAAIFTAMCASMSRRKEYNIQ